jgi:hypothetical protein
MDRMDEMDGLDRMGKRDGIRGVLRECGRFFRTHWVHLALLIPGAVLYTILHEGMHALAVILQGGRLLEFVWIPSQGEWGHVQYDFPPGATYSPFVIGMAPYFFTMLLASIAILAAVFRPGLPIRVASTIFVWFYIVPAVETSNTALPYAAYGARNDFFGAFGPPTVDLALGILLAGFGAAVLGYPVQRRLYGERALSFGAYAVLTGVAVGILFLVVLSPFVL